MSLKIKSRVGLHADLEYFLAVAQMDSLSDAARHLQVEQPTLSRALMRLESKLNFKLFFRSRQGMKLTPEGEEFYKKSSIWAEEWDSVSRLDQRGVGQLHGNLSIGCHPVLAIDFLSPILVKLLKEAPELQVSLVHDLSIRITELVNEGTLDLGIVVDPVPHPDLVIQKLEQGRAFVWTLDNPTQLQDLSSEKCVIFFHPQMHGVQKILQSLKKEPKVNSIKLVPSNDYEVIRNFVLNGLGLGILPYHAGIRQVADGASKMRELEMNLPKIDNEIALIFRSEKKSSKFFTNILKTMRS